MIKFIKEYIKNPRTVGAIAPSSKFLAEEMIRNIDFEKVKCIIEYGPGTGVFSEKIIKNCSNNTIVILLEYNLNFSNKLKEKYSNYSNVMIENDTAENIDIYLKKYNLEKADYIISGLPFTSLPTNISENILNKTYAILDKNGEFRTFQYSMLKKNLFNETFENIEYSKVVRNIPPAYVLRCSKT